MEADGNSMNGGGKPIYKNIKSTFIDMLHSFLQEFYLDNAEVISHI